MNGETSKATRRHFLRSSAVSATGVALGINPLAAAEAESATAKPSRTLVSRPATITAVSYPPLPREEPDRLNKTLARMGEYVDQAARLRSDLIAFPETCNHYAEGRPLGAGQHLSHNPQFPHKYTDGESLDGPTVTAMSRKAAEKKIYVVCPLHTVENGTLYNASVLLGRDGKIVGVYHKNFPTIREIDSGITPGTQTPVFKTDFGRVGLSVCFDLNYWEVGSGLCANEAELVIWSSMWDGARMLTRWAIEFGFYMAASYFGSATIVDVCGREITSMTHNVYDRTSGAAPPMITAQIDMDRRLLHHDYNLAKLKPIYEKYGADSIYAEWIPQECIVIFGSQMPGVSSDDLIREFQLEPMRAYLARSRRTRKQAVETYQSQKS